MIDCVDVEKLRVGHRIELGGGGALTTFVSGAFRDRCIGRAAALDVLPKLLHLKLDQHRSLAFQSVLELLAAETEAPGSARRRSRAGCSSCCLCTPSALSHRHPEGLRMAGWGRSPTATWRTR